MDSTVSEADGFDRVCPSCKRCFSEDPESCPDCGRPRPGDGWSGLEELSHDLLGSVIADRYRLERFVGSGAAGSVYRARDLRLQRPFAVKVLEVEPDASEEELLEIRRRFENEVEALSRIRNPHVVNIHEALTLEGGMPAMLTEFIEGETLEDVLAERDRLDLDAALVLTHQVANGLHEAHCRQVVHRDVKPSNIIVEQLPASGLFARVLDFGVVHLVEQDDESAGFRGTPLYAAPEQCEGHGNVGPAADIYSLGCVLYHLIAGRPPFDDTDARTILFSHVDRPPERLRDVASNSVPEEVDDLVMQMLEKDPEDRPDNFSEVVSSVEDLIRSVGDGRSMPNANTSAGLGPTTTGLAAERSAGISGQPDGNEFREMADDTDKLEQLIQFVDLEEEFPEFDADAVSCAVDSLGDSAVVSDSSGALYTLSLPGEGFAESFESVDEPVVGLTVRSKTGAILGVTRSDRVLEWTIADPASEPEAICEIDEAGPAIDLDPRTNCIYAGRRDGTLAVYDPRVSQHDDVCELGAELSHLRVVGRGQRAVAASEDGTLHVVDDLQGDPSPRELADVGESPCALGFAEGACAILVGTDDGTLHSHRLDGEYEPETIETTLGQLRGIAVTREEMVLGFSLRGSVAQTWRIRHERLRNSLSWLASGSMDSIPAVSRDVLEEVRDDKDE